MTQAESTILAGATVLAIIATLTLVLFLQTRSLRIQERLAREAAIAQAHLASSVEEVGYVLRNSRGLGSNHQFEYLGESFDVLRRTIERLVEVEHADRGPAGQRVIINSIGRESDFEWSGSLVRELAHSLNTPLLSIEALALTARATQGASPETDATLDAVNVCKSFIMAFQELTSVVEGANGWAPESLKSSVEGAFKVYSRQSNNSVVGSISLPDSVRGYSNNFLVALLLPLLENAIEASPPGGVVTLDWAESDSLVFRVKNHFEGAAPGMEVYADGHSTKSGHQGIGLSTVSRLVKTYRNGSVVHKVTGDSIQFTITLPRRRA
ncbi:ATP-binding protein [Micromonospora echinofusca]|uniref:ATP-binding protein n=1 Tax=Micromonospora echinofusca TaxID=47858 RepID=UPI0033EA5BE7